MATSYTFKYLPEPGLDSFGNLVDVYRPFIPVKLGHRRKIGRPFYALVGSGSDRNFFPAALGLVLGINVRKGSLRKVMGIGQYELKSYTHTVNFYLGSKEFKTEVDFSYEQEVPLLGRRGFFSLFKSIKFSKAKEKWS